MTLAWLFQMLARAVGAFVAALLRLALARHRPKFRRRRHEPAIGSSGRKPDWVAREVIRYKALMPEAGARRIADLFNRRFAASRTMTVSKSFVAYTLRREAWRVAEMRRTIRRRKTGPGPRNRVWGIDLTGKQTEDGCSNAILGIIDHGTRLLLGLERLRVANSWTMLGHLFLAIGRYGRPCAIRTDNGSGFTSRLFRFVLGLTGIRHQRTEPGHPWQNGRIERLLGTLKEKLGLLEVATPEALSGMLAEFQIWYNRIRPHQSLHGRTPWEEWHGIDPYAEAPRRTIWFSAWDGLITGFIHRR